MKTPIFALLLAACGGTTSGPLPPIQNPPTGCEKDADCGSGRYCDTSGTSYVCKDGPPPAVNGCAVANGQQLSAIMFACRGAVQSGQFTDSLCASGWKLCTNDDPSAIEPGGGFFLGRQRAVMRRPPPVYPNYVCGFVDSSATSTNSTRYVFGKGLKTNVELAVGDKCGGFGLMLQCWTGYAGQGQQNGVDCPWVDGDDRDAARISGGDGVLCCR